jgi:Ca2+-binding RTX toxin-like protein
MRKSVAVLASMVATLLVASGVALTKAGGPGHNVLYGTNSPDKIDGRAGDDTIYGLVHLQ